MLTKMKIVNRLNNNLAQPVTTLDLQALQFYDNNFLVDRLIGNKKEIPTNQAAREPKVLVFRSYVFPFFFLLFNNLLKP